MIRWQQTNSSSDRNLTNSSNHSSIISDGKSIEVRVDEDGGSNRGWNGIRRGKSDAVNEQRGDFDACATRKHSLQERWMQELGKSGRITDGKPVAFSQDHLSHLCDRCFDPVGNRLHIPRPIPNLVKNSTSRVELLKLQSRNLDDLCSSVSKGTSLFIHTAGKKGTRIKMISKFEREDRKELERKMEILFENDSVDVFGWCSMTFHWISHFPSVLERNNKWFYAQKIVDRECLSKNWLVRRVWMEIWEKNYLPVLFCGQKVFRN